jgi:hypothetical protein
MFKFDYGSSCSDPSARSRVAADYSPARYIFKKTNDSFQTLAMPGPFCLQCNLYDPFKHLPCAALGGKRTSSDAAMKFF